MFNHHNDPLISKGFKNTIYIGSFINQSINHLKQVYENQSDIYHLLHRCEIPSFSSESNTGISLREIKRLY